MDARGGRAVTVYGEDGWWLRGGEPIGGSEPDPPWRMNLADLETLTSGFALRDDDRWKAALQLELTEYYRCDVASVPRLPRGFPLVPAR